MKYLSRIILLGVILLTGCDRIEYTVKNSESFKTLSKAYKKIVRVPLDGQIEICEKKHNNWAPFYQCMVAAGYKTNPAWTLYWHDLVSQNWLREFPRKSFGDEMNKIIYQSGHEATARVGPEPYWIEDN